MDRIILHSDLNNFYASVECRDNKEIRNFPVAVSGNPENRHGIVLAKNMLAKQKGVKTGDTMWEAMQKCPGIIFVPPRFDRYIEISKIVRSIYYDYTDLIESFGIDECWLDVTDSVPLFPSGESIAEEIRQRVKEEIGVTVSIGVSFNKIFAKLGSDMKKPDAITIINRENYKKKVWPLPVNELLYAGRATSRKLEKLNIFTIGDLANSDEAIISRHLGKNGIMLQQYAKGNDESPVRNVEYSREVKSIGNGTTMPFDVTDIEDVKIVLMLLSESVSKRLREKNFYATTIQLGIKFNTLESIDRQAPLNSATRSVKDIFSQSLYIFKKERINMPVRALSVRACNLVREPFWQERLFGGYREENEKLDIMSDDLRNKYGWEIIQRGLMLENKRLSGLNPTDDNTLQKIAFFKG